MGHAATAKTFSRNQDPKQKSDLRPLCADTVEKLDFLPRSQFLRQQAGFKKKALRVRQKG